MIHFRYFSVLVGLLFYANMFAQNATVTAKNYDISDNLDLQAVASVFGDSKDLADFEFRLNDPEMRLSNLDLNRDGYVDYLRVIEAVEGKTHLIVIQAVLGQDVFQDVATIEVEKDRRNQVQVQVVGNSYIYGNNYIYEPVYVHTPSVFSFFWSTGYSPYYSSWYWNYYPTYFNYWQPYPVYSYVNHVHLHINRNNRYVYATNRNSSKAVRMHREIRANAYERDNPRNSFSNRNNNTSNRYVLQQNRGVESSRVTNARPTSNRVENASSSRPSNRVNTDSNYRRGNATTSSREYNATRNSSQTRQATSASRVQSSNTRESSSRVNSARSNNNTSPSRVSRPSNVSPRSSNFSSQPSRIQRTSSPNTSSFSRGSNSSFSSGRSSAPSTRSSGSVNSSRSGSSNRSSR